MAKYVVIERTLPYIKVLTWNEQILDVGEYLI